MGTFISWVIWHGPYRSRQKLQKAIIKAEEPTSPLREGARLYLAVGRQKRLSLSGSQILYIGRNALGSDKPLSERATESLFDEKKIRGWLNEYWFGVIENSFTPLEKVKSGIVSIEPDGAALVDQTEAALIFFSNPLRNKTHVFPTRPFSFRVISQFKKPWLESVMPTSLERLLPKLIAYDHKPKIAPVFRFGSFSSRLTWSKKAALDCRRPQSQRDRQEADCLRQRIAEDPVSDNPINI